MHQCKNTGVKADTFTKKKTNYFKDIRIIFLV